MPRHRWILSRRMAVALAVGCVASAACGATLGVTGAPEFAYYLGGILLTAAAILYVMAPQLTESTNSRPAARRRAKDRG